MLLRHGRNRRGWFTLLVSLYCNCSFPQDTPASRIKFDLNTELQGLHIFERLDAPVNMPENIRYRRSHSINTPSDFYSITDNPLKHGAYYASIKTITTFSSAFKVNVDIYGEHRGISYGVFNTQNMIMFPVITALLSDSIICFRKKLFVAAKVGHFLNERSDHGLIVYNTDVQGVQGILGMNSWKLAYALYGDLNNGIGLNIDDFHTISIKKNFGVKRNIVIGVSLAAIAPPGAKKADNLVWSVSGKSDFNRGEIYFQAGYRNMDKQDPNFRKRFVEQTALVIGHKLNFESKALEFRNQLEFRYYGQSFNKNNYIGELKYREDLTQQPLYANTIGEHLYPLRKFETPFSQWAIFTEYQGMNIAGLTLFGILRYKYSAKTEIDLSYDFNQILTGRDTAFAVRSNNNFFYPFFTLGFFYKPVTKVKAGIILTNKGMNLDLSYPTHYLFESPYLGIKMSMSFN